MNTLISVIMIVLVILKLLIWVSGVRRKRRFCHG